MTDFLILITPLEAIILVGIPVVLIRLGGIPASYRLIILCLLTGIVGVLATFRHPTFEQVGLNGFQSWNESILYYGIYVFIAVPVLITLAKWVGSKPVRKWWRDPHFLFLFIPISIVQQLLFQSIFLTSFVAAFGAALPAIGLTAFLFGCIHIIYPRPVFSFVIGTIGGACFAVLFIICGNIWIAIIAHAILNFVAVQRSLFSLLDEGVAAKTKIF